MRVTPILYITVKMYLCSGGTLRMFIVSDVHVYTLVVLDLLR